MLVEVAKTLRGVRTLAETCCERTLLYFIDMAIFEACEELASAPNAQLRVVVWTLPVLRRERPCL